MFLMPMSAVGFGAYSAVTGYEPAGALWLDDAPMSLSWTPAATPTGSQRIMTFSWWQKITNVSDSWQMVFGNSGSGYVGTYQNSGDHYFSYTDVNGSTAYFVTSNRMFRDPTAWQHFCLSINSNTTASLALEVNGVAHTSFSASTLANNANLDFTKNGVTHFIGLQSSGSSNGFEGYLADVILIDGQKLAASNFGETDKDTGIWVPKDPSELTFGNNGFWLDFSDGTEIGRDASTSVARITSSDYIGDMTSSGGLAAAFNNAVEGQSSSAKTGAAASYYIGQDHGSGNSKIVTGFRLFGPNDARFSNNATHTLKLYGSDSAPSNNTDGTQLWTGSLDDTASSGTIKEVNSSITTTTGYRYHWITVTDSDSGGSNAVSELQLFEGGTDLPNSFFTSSVGAYNIVVDGPVNNATKEITIYPSPESSRKNSNITLSNNDLTVDSGSATGYSVPLNIPLSSGRWQITATVNAIDTSNGGPGLGFAYTANYSNATNAAADPSNFFGMRIRGGPEIQCNNNSTSWNPDNSGTLSTGHTLTLLIDIAAGKAWALQNGTVLQDSSQASVGNPAVGTQTNPTFTFTADSSITLFMMATSSATITLNPTTVNSTYSDYLAITSTATGVGNYCTWNPTANGGDVTLSEGNQVMTAPNPNDNNFVYGTHAMRTGKWYMEFGFIRAVDFNDSGVYLVDQTFDFSSNGPHTTASDNQWGITLESNTQLDLRHSNSRTSNSSFTLPDGESWDYENDRLLMAFDADNKKVWFGMYDTDSSKSYWLENDGTFETTQQPSTAAPSFATTGVVSGEEFSGEGWYLCGHFNDNGNTGNKMRMYAREHEWVGTAPTGFKALATHNYAEPTVTDPSAYFFAKTYTGNSDSENPRNVTGFQDAAGNNITPDLVWIKSTSDGYSHTIWDSVRGFGNGKELMSDATSAEGSQANNNGNVSGVVAGGFTATESGSDSVYVNEQGKDYVAWMWKAGGSGSANTDGSTNYDSTVSVADHSGFSIVKWTSHSSVSSGTKVGHGMGKKPEIIIIKSTTQADNWHFWHKDLSGTGKYLKLNLNHGEADDSGNAWDGHANTNTSTFSVGDGGGSSWTNDANETYTAYCFARTPGLIGIGKYTGNASTDGPNIIIDDGASGFRPAFILEKRTDAAGAWYITDVARNTYNPVNLFLMADAANGDGTGTTSSGAYLDVTANGYKIRGTSSGQEYNRSGTYIYLAFAETPFGLNNRAR